MSHQEVALGPTQDTLDGLKLLVGLGAPSCPARRVEVGGPDLKGEV